MLEWLQNNKDTTRAAEVLKMLVTKPIAPNTKLTLLVPTNQVCRAGLEASGRQSNVQKLGASPK